MTVRPLKNVAASVYYRLKNKARESNRRLDELLRYFAMERFLYRLSKTPHRDNFVLKGALMFKVWRVASPRPTMDIDLLGAPETVQHVDAIVRELCGHKIEPPDGLVFDPESVKTGPIAEQTRFDAVRTTFRATLVNARIPMQIDVGFGTVSPSPVMVDLPAILDFPAPHLRGYTQASSIAEKFHAMVMLDVLNSRMKDFFDIWLLSRQFEFEADALARAIAETFAHRNTIVPMQIVALSETFVQHPSKAAQWAGFLRKHQLADHAPASLAEVVEGISRFLGPVAQALATNAPYSGHWAPGGPWER